MMRSISRKAKEIFGLMLLFLAVSALVTRAAEPDTQPDAPQAPPVPSGRTAARASSSSQPNYPVPYRVPRADSITRVLRAVKSQLEASVMTTLSTRPSTNTQELAAGRRFALNTYAMGVVYSGMLSAADATGDQSFDDFVAKRLQLVADAVAKVDLSHIERHRGDVTYLLSPTSLDDCGSIGASLVEARRANVGPDLQVAIDHIADYISHKQFLLAGGTLARPWPLHDSLWSDDTYMSIPFLAQMGALTGDNKYFDDAAGQMLHFEDHLFVPAVGLFTHHWNTANPDNQPKYFWGRANGWCTVSLAELLDVLPENHPLRGRILRLFRANAEALAGLQAGDGLWHQMLDRTDSYTETSCSAMFTYALAKGVNRGWIDAPAYGPVVLAAWNGLSGRVDEQGHVTGTCIGTSYADDYVYYYHRPASDDIHGYGPTLLAGSEVIRLLKNPRLRIFGGDRGTPLVVIDRDAAGARPPGQ
jgi:unsaturated rhamnogalacturonyl hydrolase